MTWRGAEAGGGDPESDENRKLLRWAHSQTGSS